MGRLSYAAIASLDGYIADESGSFEWAFPSAEVHAVMNDLERPVGTNLLGRRMYEVMLAWETWDVEGEPPEVQDFASLWHASDKIVYSRTLDTVASERTRIERDFDPDAIRALKWSAARDLSIGGADLAGQALSAGLVDDLHLVITPVVVGGGTRALPDGVRLDLDLQAERTFDNGFAYLHYRVRT